MLIYLTPLQEETDLRLQAVELFLGLPKDEVSMWPGTLVFCRHIEKYFVELLDPKFSIVWHLLRQKSPSTPVECWRWCFMVIETFQGLEDDDPSIEKAYRRLLENASKSPNEIEIHDKLRVLQAIFAVLCWTSATLKPLMETPTPSDREIQAFFLEAENSSQKYSTKDLRRPISKMFYSFRNHTDYVDGLEPLSRNDVQRSEGISNEMLYESSLNYFSLFTIGRIRLKWVDTLTAHLDFDRQTRILSVFRFPSFCVANALRTKDLKILSGCVLRLFINLIPTVMNVNLQLTV